MLQQTRTLYAFESDEFEEVQDLSLCLEEPVPDEDNPVVKPGDPGDPDDSKICYTASVERCREGYGMWYQAEDRQGRHTRCFASSPDGFQWAKHGVVGDGIFNTLGNSFNVYNDGERFLAPLTSLGTDPSIDPAFAALRPQDIPDSRRRSIAERGIAKSGRQGIPTFVGVASSADGLQWEMPAPTPRLPMMLETPWICRFQGRYIMNAQTHGSWFDPPVPGVRRVAFFTSDDLIDWTPHPAPMVNEAHEAIGGQAHVGIVPIKCIDDRLLIGLGGRFDDGSELPDMHYGITLLHSSNGLDWKPVVPSHERRNWIRRGRPGEWDVGGVAQMGMVENGDQAAVYYVGNQKGNGSHSLGMYDPGRFQVGRARFRRDRFAALQPSVRWKAIFPATCERGARGTVTTRPISLSPDRPLALNVDIPSTGGSDAGAVNVELLGPEDAVIDAATIREGGIDKAVPLKRTPPEHPVRLRITMTGACAPDRVPRLYAIRY